MSRIRAAANATTARADAAFRKLSDHCLRTCPTCRPHRRETCDTAWALHRAWFRARREARR